MRTTSMPKIVPSKGAEHLFVTCPMECQMDQPWMSRAISGIAVMVAETFTHFPAGNSCANHQHAGRQYFELLFWRSRYTGDVYNNEFIRNERGKFCGRFIFGSSGYRRC